MLNILEDIFGCKFIHQWKTWFRKKIFLLKAVRFFVGMSYHVTCFDMFLLDFGNGSGTTSSFPIKMLETIWKKKTWLVQTRQFGKNKKIWRKLFVKLTSLSAVISNHKWPVVSLMSIFFSLSFFLRHFSLVMVASDT